MTRAEIITMLERDHAWYEERGREMKTSKDQLALALVIGATKALREALEAIKASGACPFCNNESAFRGSPDDTFCEEHLRQYRMTGAA